MVTSVAPTAPPTSAEALPVDLARALGDPLRWSIVELLANEQLCVANLAEELGAAQPLVSHHLKVLRQAGLIGPDRYRYWTYYRLRPGVLIRLAVSLGELARSAVHNAGRSQMAAALLDHHAKGKVHVRSAGSAPADQINPAVAAAMGEWGIDLSREFPKPLTDEFVPAGA